MSAAAVPARRGCRSRASAAAFGMTMPTVATNTNSITVSPASRPSSAAPSSPAAATTPATRVPTSRVRGVNRSSSRRLAWLMPIRPTALSPKSRLNTVGETPYPSCSTNDEPEM